MANVIGISWLRCGILDDGGNSWQFSQFHSSSARPSFVDNGVRRHVLIRSQPRAIIPPSFWCFCPVLQQRGRIMPWYTYVAYVFGGAFLVNAVPHFVNGVSGRSFPTPFASPPGKGQSSPMVNVIWGTLNAAVGYFLVCHVGEFHIRDIRDVLVLGAGGLLMGIQLAWWFGRATAVSRAASWTGLVAGSGGHIRHTSLLTIVVFLAGLGIGHFARSAGIRTPRRTETHAADLAAIEKLHHEDIEATLSRTRKG
jgi:hypothetical protein